MPGDCAFYDAGCQISAIAEGAADATLGAFLRWMAESVRVTAQMGRLAMAEITEPQLAGWWKTGPFTTMWWISGSLLVLLVVVALIDKMVRSDTAGMVRIVGLGVPSVLLGMSLVPWLATTLASWTDSASAGIEAQSNGSIDAVWSSLETTLGGEGVGGGLLLVVLQVAMLFAVLILYLAMLLRTVAIYLVVAAVPLAIVVGMVPAAKKVMVRTIEVSVVLIISKLFIAMALYVGAAGLAGTLDAGAVGPTTQPGRAAATSTATTAATGAVPAGKVGEAERLNAAAAGVLILFVAGFAPLALMSLIPGAEAAVESARGLKSGAREARQKAGQISGGDRLMSAGRMAGGMAMSQGVGMAMGKRLGNKPDAKRDQLVKPNPDAVADRSPTGSAQPNNAGSPAPGGDTPSSTKQGPARPGSGPSPDTGTGGSGSTGRSGSGPGGGSGGSSPTNTAQPSNSNGSGPGSAPSAEAGFGPGGRDPVTGPSAVETELSGPVPPVERPAAGTNRDGGDNDGWWDSLSTQRP